MLCVVLDGDRNASCKYKLEILVYVFSWKICGYTQKIVDDKFIVCAAQSSKCLLSKKYTSLGFEYKEAFRIYISPSLKNKSRSSY